MESKFRNRVNRWVEWLLVLLMLLLVVDVLLQVASRYLLQNSVSFTDELAGFLLIWVSLLGAAYAAGQKEHLAITMVYDKMNAVNQQRLRILIDGLILLFAITVLVVGGTWLVASRFMLGQFSASLQLSLGYVYLVVPISGLLTAYYMLDDIAHTLRKPKVGS